MIRADGDAPVYMTYERFSDRAGSTEPFRPPSAILVAPLLPCAGRQDPDYAREANVECVDADLAAALDAEASLAQDVRSPR